MEKKYYCFCCQKELSMDLFHANSGYCHECKPPITSYVISHDLSKYEAVLDLRLNDCECKHIMYVDQNSQIAYDEAISAKFPNIIWGFYRNATRETENKTINKMISDNFMKAVRITITENHVWIDNTHTVISYIRRFGEDTRIKEIPCYIVDLRNELPVLCADPNNIIFVEDSIRQSIRNSMRINYLELHGGRHTSWTIKNLRNQIE